MIRLTCTNCKTVLVIDDGFAGGVCRCQHCGTIQTVPAHLKGSGAAEPVESGMPSPQVSQGGPKALYQVGRRSGGGASGNGSPSGIDQLGDVITSSGLTRSGLHLGARPEDPKSSRRQMIVIGAVAAGAVVLAVLVTWLLMRGGGGGGGSGDGGSAGGGGGAKNAAGTAIANVQGPSFVGLPIKGPSVAYVLDRGQGSREIFEPLKSSLYKSLGSALNMKYQAVFWATGGVVMAYPENGQATAGRDSIDKARQYVEGSVFAQGASRLGPALQKALQRKPDEVIVITGKDDMDDELADLLAIRDKAKSKAPIHTFAVGQLSCRDLLKELAEKTGGTYTEVSRADLEAFVKR